MLHKKYYKDIAKIIVKTMNKADNSIWQDLVNELAGYFKEDNPLFDKAKFILACAKNP